MGDVWDQEDAWVRTPQMLRQFDSRNLDLTLVHSEEYVNYLRLTLPPAHASDAEVRRAREKLAATPIVEVILAHQQPDGSWPLGGPPWFRVYPRPLMVLLEYGMYEHPSVQRGFRYLLSAAAPMACSIPARGRSSRLLEIRTVRVDASTTAAAARAWSG